MLENSNQTGLNSSLIIVDGQTQKNHQVLTINELPRIDYLKLGFWNSCLGDWLQQPKDRDRYPTIFKVWILGMPVVSAVLANPMIAIALASCECLSPRNYDVP